MADNEGSLPYFSTPSTTKSTIQRSGTASIGLGFMFFASSATSKVLTHLLGRTLLNSETPMLSGTQQNIQELDTSANIDPVKQVVMQTLYHNALGIPNTFYQQHMADEFFGVISHSSTNGVLSPHGNADGSAKSPGDAAKAAAPFLYGEDFKQLYQSIQPGWVCVGRLSDVPKHAAYVGHRGKTFVWVKPQNLAQLTNLTIAVVDVATANTADGGVVKVPKPLNARENSGQAYDLVRIQGGRSRVSPASAGGNNIAPAPP